MATASPTAAPTPRSRRDHGIPATVPGPTGTGGRGEPDGAAGTSGSASALSAREG